MNCHLEAFQLVYDVDSLLQVQMFVNDIIDDPLVSGLEAKFDTEATGIAHCLPRLHTDGVRPTHRGPGQSDPIHDLTHAHDMAVAEIKCVVVEID